MPKKSRLHQFKKISGQRPQKQVQPQIITRQDMDRLIFDMVMGEIYENSHVNELHFDEILSKYKVELPVNERERIWDVLITSSLVSPMIGFGQAGKLELTPQGFQLMTQYGSYSNFLAATQPQPLMQPAAATPPPGVDASQQQADADKKKNE
ncbi:MAG TPA: hypothetical protein VL098_00950 [Flavipsychrobacter sp.]|nr:hypothetical protein [Flavipsychrobacter sp.]